MCKTHYLIREDAKAERIMLTKTKDLNQCQERIVKDIGLAYTEKCVECEAVSAISLSLHNLYYPGHCWCDDIVVLVNAERTDPEGSRCF